MKRIITITAMGIYILIAIAALARGLVDRAETIHSTGSTEQTQQPSTATEPEGFLVKSVNGVVAVEELKSGEIIKTTDTRVAILPENDRRRLESGIEVRDEHKLRRIIEDLCS